MPEAFVLFKTEPAKEREVYLELSGNPSVSEVHVLYGEFDLLIRYHLVMQKASLGC